MGKKYDLVTLLLIKYKDKYVKYSSQIRQTLYG